VTLKVSRNLGIDVTRDLAASLGYLTLGSGNEPVVDPDQFLDDSDLAFNEARNHEEFAYHYMRSSVFSKYDTGDPSLEAETLASFVATDVTCGVINKSLVGGSESLWVTPQIWNRARRKVHAVLGRFPWEQFPRACGFGPGASTSLRRRLSSHQNKWELSTHITEPALPYYDAFRNWSGIALPDELSVVAGNRVTTVPKSYKTRRVIAVEPDWNSFLQKGVGALIRRRLQRVGLLLPDAQFHNRRLAQEGSITGRLATLDLKSASDMVSMGLCEALLPSCWLKVIYDLRSPMGVMPSGEVITYEKVSSMGNGCTFELETLLFWALVWASSDRDDRDVVSVYGDDVICRHGAVPVVINTLAEAGLETNPDKSFWSGDFRESCGGHYFRGFDVTPFYVRQNPRSLLDLIVLHNAIEAWLERVGNPDFDPFQGVKKRIRSAVPRQFWGPRGVDGVLWSEWDQTRPRWNKDFQSYRMLRLVRNVQYEDVGDLWGSVLHKLWNVDEELEGSRWPVATDSVRRQAYYCDRESFTVNPLAG
jgi:hypothetical protein